MDRFVVRACVHEDMKSRIVAPIASGALSLLCSSHGSEPNPAAVMLAHPASLFGGSRE
jgi:hypothetical protein